MRLERSGQKEQPPGEEETRRRLEEEGYLPTLWDASPGMVYPDYVHSREEIVWVISGTARLRVGEEECELWPGDRVWVPARTLHTLEVTGDKPLVFFAALRRA